MQKLSDRQKGEIMKATGISRRIDSVGRIVIPVEIRTRLGIRSGDPIEIFTHNNEIVLRKYDVSIGLSGLVKRLHDEFYAVMEDLPKETADKICGHINALQALMGDNG